MDSHLSKSDPASCDQEAFNWKAAAHEAELRYLESRALQSHTEAS